VAPVIKMMRFSAIVDVVSRVDGGDEVYRCS
jgi:hypothetical protein